MRNLSEIRTEIDSIDEQIIELFKKRMDCAKDVGNYKKANNILFLIKQERMKFLIQSKSVAASTVHTQDCFTQILWSFQELYNIILSAVVQI